MVKTYERNVKLIRYCDSMSRFQTVIHMHYENERTFFSLTYHNFSLLQANTVRHNIRFYFEEDIQLLWFYL